MADTITFRFDPVDDMGFVATPGNEISWTFDAGLPGADGTSPFSQPTPWAPSTAYIVFAPGYPASCVTYLGSTYVCTTAHTSGVTFDSSKWRQIAANGLSVINDASDIDPAITDSSADSPYLLAASLTNKARKIGLGATGRSLLGAVNASAAATILGLGSYARLDAANTFALGQTVQSLTLSGNISAPSWMTNGLRIRGVAATLTDTTSTGTVTAAYTDAFGGNTIAASNATTFTDYYTAFFRRPVAGTNATLTNRWALGAETLTVGTAKQLTVDASGTVTASGTGPHVFGTTNTLTIQPSSGGSADITLNNSYGGYRFRGGGGSTINLESASGGVAQLAVEVAIISDYVQAQRYLLSGGGRLTPITNGARVMNNSQSADGNLIVGNLTASGTVGFTGLSSTSTVRSQALITPSWADSTDATRQGRLSLGVYGIVSSVETLQTGLTITARSSGTPLLTFAGEASIPTSWSWTPTPANSNLNTMLYTSGTGSQTGFTLFGKATATNASYGQVQFVDSQGLQLASTANGAGSIRPVNIIIGGTSRIQCSSTGIGFFNATPVAQQALPGAGVVTAGDIRTALINLGLCV